MKRIGILLIAVMGIVAGAAAQDVKMPVDLERLAAKASETTEVTLNGHMLQVAAKFMNDEGDAEARELVKKLKGIYVRSFQFDKIGEYSSADVDSIRTQLRSPLWEKVVGVHSKKDGENAEIYFKSDSGDQIERQRRSCKGWQDIRRELLFKPGDIVFDSHCSLPNV